MSYIINISSMIVTRVNKLLSGIDNAERSLHTVRAYIVTMINDG